MKLSFQEKGHNCGGKLNLLDKGSEINISSPNYPNIPMPHVECEWIIRGPAGETLELEFIDNFYLISDDK